MRKSRFTEEQIRHAVQLAEAGLVVSELCHRYGVSVATFYRWRQRYGAPAKGDLRRLNELEQENSRLKAIVADMTLDKQMRLDVRSKED